MNLRPPISTLFPYTTLFRSLPWRRHGEGDGVFAGIAAAHDVGAPLDGCAEHVPQKPLFGRTQDRKSTRLNSSHRCISYAVFCLKKKTYNNITSIHLES